MKNNEYNKVNISNEKNNFSAEYTTAQNVEYSFQPENKDSYKDELNDRHIVNDKVEDNLLKQSKEKKKEESKDVKEVAKSSSSIGHAVVASATVAVASAGIAIGVTIINPQPNESITFISSEVTTNSVDFSFSMPISLLSYEEKEEQTGPRYNKSVVASIANGDDHYYFEQYLQEYEEVDEYVVFYAYMDGLNPDTSYALNLSLRYEYLEYEDQSFDQLLASRTFKTQSVGQALRFEEINADQDSVYFSFVVDNSAIDYDPTTSDWPAIQASISDGIDFYNELWIESFEEYDENHIIGYGEFSGLTADTTYTITIRVSLEEEFKEIGFTTFVTEPKPDTGFRIVRLTPEEESVIFNYSVLADYIGYTEGGELPNVIADVSLDGTTVAQQRTESFSLYGDYAVGFQTISGLTGETTYKLSIYYVHDDEQELLGFQEFTTTEVSAPFYFADIQYFYIGDDYISSMFYIKPREVQASPTSSDESNIYMTITGGMAYSETVNVPMSAFQDSMEGLYFVRHLFENLDSNIDYTISVFNDNTGEEYGSITIKTTGPETGLIIESMDVSETNVNATFYLNKSYVTNTGGVSAVIITESGEQVGTTQAQVNNNSTETQYQFDAYFTFSSSLENNKTYILGIYYNSGTNNQLVGVHQFTVNY